MRRSTTKSALLMSVISLFLCFAMLMGSTFAWFTDVAESAKNLISAGNLDIELYHSDSAVTGEKVTGTTYLFDDVTSDKWEPGAMAYEKFTVKNEGNLALKYEFTLNALNATVVNGKSFASMLKVAVVGADFDYTRENIVANTTLVWNELATFTLDGELTAGGSEDFGIIIWWQPSENDNLFNMNNDNSGKKVSVEVGVVLTATQLNSESDSIDKDYDVDAVLPGNSAVEELGNEEIVLMTEGENATTVVLSAELVGALSAEATAVSIKSTAPDVVVDGGNVSVVYNIFEIVDQNGDVIDLSDNTVVIPVKLYVGTDYAGKNATVAHDGVVVANVTVDAEGYVSYNTTHFCAISVAIADEAPADSITDVKDESVEEADLTKLIQVRVGNHYYTVSQGMANSWYEYPSVPGKIEANVYVPEDLIAFAMMYNNGDLKETGSHSDLTLVNDLDYKGYNWVPIGRFYTNIHGNGKTVSNLNDSFFGCVYDCQLYDITIKNVNASGSASGVLGKELAGDIYFGNVTIAGENTVTYVADNATNWPEGGTGVGAICGVSLISYTGIGEFDVTLTGTITVNYNGVCFGNTTGLEIVGVSEEYGVNLYMANANDTLKINGGSIVTNGVAHCYSNEIAEGFVQDILNNGKYYVISSAEGLTAFAEYVNGENETRNKTFTLLDDVDLENKAWTPIGVSGFNGTFDGNGYTVYNLNVTADTSAGLFGYLLNGGNIKNLTVENATVKANDYAGAILGRGYTDVVNCHVINANITVTPYYDEAKGIYDGGAKAGGVVGQLLEGEGNTVVGCTAKNVTITGYRDLGGVLGMAHNNNSVSDCSAENVTIKYVSVDGVYDDGETPNQNAGAIVGRIQSSATVSEDILAANGNFKLVAEVTSVESLMAALNNKASEIILKKDIEGATIKLPATLNNVTVKGTDGVALINSTVMSSDGNAISYDGLTFDGVTFENSRIILTGWRTGGATIKNLTVTNCVFKNIDDTTNNAAVHINVDAKEAVENFVFTNNVIDGATGGSKSGVYAQITGKTEFSNNVINNVAFRPYVIQVTTDDGIADEFIVTGNTFSGSSAGRAQGLGNNAEGTDSVKLVVSGNIFKDITNAQQICYWNFNSEKTTADLSGNYYDCDIAANPGKIYYNKSASSVEDLVDMGVYPFYTELNEDGTINEDSLVVAP